MIPEYKLYHGAVLAELIHAIETPVTLEELTEEGRLSSYVLNKCVGLQIKHSSQRLHPWPFTFTKSNLMELMTLRAAHPSVFVVLVCHTDGMVCVSLEELLDLLKIGGSEQAWVRVDRRKGKWYSLDGAGAVIPRKKPNGLDALIESLAASTGCESRAHAPAGLEVLATPSQR